MKTRSLLLPTLVTAALGLVSSPSQAALTFTMDETGSDIIVGAGGSIDLGTATTGDSLFAGALLNPAQAILSVGPSGTTDQYGITVISGPSSFGTATSAGVPTVAVGNRFSFSGGPNAQLGLPAGYTSNTGLTATNIFPNVSFQSLGIVPGTYTWEIAIPQVGGGSINDFITLQVIPEPATAAMLALGGLLLGVRRRR